MTSALKFVLRVHTLPFCGILFLYALLVSVLNQLFPGGYFSMYYAAFSLFCIIILAMSAISLGGVHMNLALSMGACRRDYCRSVHADILLTTLFALTLHTVLYHFQTRFSIPESAPSLTLSRTGEILFYCLAGQFIALGAISFSQRSQITAGLISGLSTMLLISGYLFSSLLTTLHWSQLYILSRIITILLILAAVGGELLFLHTLRRAAVK